MTVAPTDWNAIALKKLTNVLGAQTAEHLSATILRDLELERLVTAGDLRRFAEALSREGGFAAAVGGLLGLHAAMYGGPVLSSSNEAR